MLLTEHISPLVSKCLYEDAVDEKTGKKKLFMQGIFIQGGVKNHNERIYPVHEINKAVDNINKKLHEGYSVCGEIDHPEELTINLDRITHKIVKMWMDGAAGLGKLEVLPTPQGNLIRTLIESDVKLGVSSRGVGNVDDRGHVSDFEIITVDIVMNPSAPQAYPKPVYESLNARRGRIIGDLAEAVSHDPKAQKHLHRELLTWINDLRK